MTEFSTQDAQALITHVESAPLAHLQHAKKVQELIHRFAEWFNSLPEREQKLHAEISELKSKLGLDS